MKHLSRPALALVAAIALTLCTAGSFLSSHPEAAEASTGLSDLDATNAIAARFGQTTSAVLVVSSADGTSLFTAARVQAFSALVQKLRTSGLCKAVVSFMSLPEIVNHDDETEVRDLVDKLPATDAEASALGVRALAHENGAGELLAPGGRAALIMCPFEGQAEEAAVLAKVIGGPLDVQAVGPRAAIRAFGHDLARSGLLFGVVGMLVLLAAARSASGRAGAALIGLVALALVYIVAPSLWANPSGNLLGRALGPAASAALARLDQVTNANRTLLMVSEADHNSAQGLNQTAALCATLERAGLPGVRCPTAVIETMSKAMTGVAALPANDEQLKALWFFGGDRAELGLVFGAERKSALIRATLPDGTIDTALLARLRALSNEKHVLIGGMPLIHQSAGLLLIQPICALLFVAFGFVLARRGAARGALQAGAALALGALFVSPALIALALALPGIGLCLGAALAPGPKKSE